jgi:hypothetical protein
MSLLNKASFLVTPNGYKEDKLYAAIPTNGDGDMTFTRATTATRVNEAGLVELVPYNLLSRSEEFNDGSWQHNANITVTSSSELAPNGNLEANLIEYDGSGYSFIRKTQIAPSTATLSVFAKKGNWRYLGLRNFQTSGTHTVFDFDTETFTNTASGQTASFEIFPNGWYRVKVTQPSPLTNNHGFAITNSSGSELNATGGEVANIHLWGAQLVEGSSAKTYQKTVDRLDIPRIDYTDAKRTNLLTYSENFDDASFVKNLSEAIETDSTIAPDGTLTADTWTGHGDSGSHYLAQTVSATSGVAYTQSVFAKKGTNNFLQIVGTGAIYDANSWANFDLENGVVGTAGASATATITDFGNGWYRCTMTATAITTASGIGFLLWLITSATAGRAEGNSLATSVHLWGAQLEAGAYPTSYIPTTTGTVTIYDGCPSILLEPQRTNLLLRSQEFDNGGWVKTNLTVTANTVIAPDGTLTGDKLVEDTAATIHRMSQSITASTANYTFSVYAKSSEKNKIGVLFSGTGIGFNLLDGTTFSLASGETAATIFSITSVGNGWYKCGVTVNTSNPSAAIRLVSNTSPLYIWGAQLEAGAYPTSYIPTTTATVTRNADAISKTGISDLLNPSEGTFYAEISALANDLTNRILSLSDGTGDNTVQIRFSSVSNQIRLDIYGQSASYRSTVTVSDTTENHKVLIKWGPSGIFGFIDGDKYTFFLASGTGSGIPTALNRINFSVLGGC